MTDRSKNIERVLNSKGFGVEEIKMRSADGNGGRYLITLTSPPSRLEQIVIENTFRSTYRVEFTEYGLILVRRDRAVEREFAGVRSAGVR